MSDISIQFHALPSEMERFVKAVVSDFSLHVTALRFFPFEAKEVQLTEFEDIFVEKSPFTRLTFTLNRPCLVAENELQFADKNPDHLRLEIGKQSPQGLAQSWLVARTNIQQVLTTWKAIAKRLKNETKAGVTVINRKTGATAVSRSFRYSAGAKALESTGVTMLPFAGGCEIKLHLPESKSVG